MVNSFASGDPRPVDCVLGLLNRAIAILDSENLPIAAAKVDEARAAIRSADARIDAAFWTDMLGDGTGGADIIR